MSFDPARKGIPQEFTAVPNVFLDSQMADCSGAEVKVFLYITRRTIGMSRARENDGWDEISLNQVCNGILRRDGRRLDSGTGLERQAAVDALHRLVAKGIVERRQGDGRRADSYRIAGVLLTNRSALPKRYENQTASGAAAGPQNGMKIRLPPVRKSRPQKKSSSAASYRSRSKRRSSVLAAGLPRLGAVTGRLLG